METDWYLIAPPKISYKKGSRIPNLLATFGLEKSIFTGAPIKVGDPIYDLNSGKPVAYIQDKKWAIEIINADPNLSFSENIIDKEEYHAPRPTFLRD